MSEILFYSLFINGFFPEFKKELRVDIHDNFMLGMLQICRNTGRNKKGLCQCAKLQDLGDGDFDCYDCYCSGGETKSNPTL